MAPASRKDKDKDELKVDRVISGSPLKKTRLWIPACARSISPTSSGRTRSKRICASPLPPQGGGRAARPRLALRAARSGKTTLAFIIAKEMGVSIRVTSGPAIERTGDLAAILTNLHKDDILFIDEIHRINRAVDEVLYPAMEDFALDIMIGKGPGARSLRLDLAAVYTHRGDDPIRPAFAAVTRPFRRCLSPRFL